MPQPLNVAVPWSLSHYIPLDGFAPRYRALFDHAPKNISFSAWDNVNLSRKLRRNVFIRKQLVDRVQREEHHFDGLAEGSIARRYKEYFCPPNHVLTAALAGDIEFHHTAPFPSLKRPFIFHCETFASVFAPFVQRGNENIEHHEGVREHYRKIFAHRRCLGIFSHVPETLRALSLFFSDPTIDGKLFSSKIGLSADVFFEQDTEQKPSLSRPRFLFVNSSNQNMANFFHRGGHLVLRFWKRFTASGRDGLLILRCGKPSDIALREYGVDVSWVKDEIGRSIVWDQGYRATHEMQSLMASAHFFLLPSVAPHSVSIMEAMRAGAIPIVTDTVGTSAYVTDEENGIVLRGVQTKVWQKDAVTDILVDHYYRRPELDRFLVEQLTTRICQLLEDHGAYWDMHRRTIVHAQT
ncbi:MAG: glycosyltransferase, partial [Nitrospira sp.]